MITKSEYLQARMADKSKSQIAQEAGMSVQKLYKLLDQWELMTAEDERRAINTFKSVQAIDAAFKEIPNSRVPADGRTTRASTAEPAAKDKRNLAPLFKWIVPITQTSAIRITKNGLRITGQVARNLRSGDQVRVGIFERIVAIQRLPEGERGWSIKLDTKTGSLMIPGKRVSRAVAAQGILPGTVLQAEWDDQNNWVIGDER